MAIAPLESLVRAGWDVGLVVTRADTRRGRGGARSPSPVKAAALRLGLPVAHEVDAALDVGADLGVVVAYGRIISRRVLQVLPMVNLHFSLLPRWRGAAPVERALLAGEEETGVTLMQVEEGLDTGPVFACRPVPIGPRTTAAELRDVLVREGTDLLMTTLTAGLGEPTPQQGDATYASKLEPAELELDWSQPVVALDRLIRVGGAWTISRGRRLKVLAAEPVEAPDDGGGPHRAGRPEPGRLEGDSVGAGDGFLRLITVQPEGKGPMTAAAWLNGLHPSPDERLG
jgi:methionyl-tRNA formyltransferase